MKYETLEKKIKFIMTKGNIATFKRPFIPQDNPVFDGHRTQILVSYLRKDKSGAVKIEGRFYNSIWYKNLDELIEAIDWEQMELWH